MVLRASSLDLRNVTFLGFLALGACGAPGPAAEGSKAGAEGATGGGGAAADGGSGGGGKEERPFAGSLQEATTAINAVLDKRQGDINACVKQFRVRRADHHGKVSVSFGIDQEGRLLGVTSKGKEDAELKSCVQDGLRGAPFPRSNAGLITITKTYEELVQ